MNARRQVRQPHKGAGGRVIGAATTTAPASRPLNLQTSLDYVPDSASDSLLFFPFSITPDSLAPFQYIAPLYGDAPTKTRPR